MENNENKRNLMLLVVIALVTVVAIVAGATYAYLASSVDSRKEQTINATLDGSSDLLTIKTGDKIEITGSEDNLCKTDLASCTADAEGVKASTTAEIALKSSSAVGYNYKLKLVYEADEHSIEYSNGACYKTADAEVDDKVGCTGAGKVWGAMWANGTVVNEESCYSVTSDSSAAAVDNALSCDLQGYKWIADPAEPELQLKLTDDEGNTVGTYDITKGSEFLKSSCTTSEGTVSCDLATDSISVDAPDYQDVKKYTAEVVLRNIDGINQIANAGKKFGAKLVVENTGRI